MVDIDKHQPGVGQSPVPHAHCWDRRDLRFFPTLSRHTPQSELVRTSYEIQPLPILGQCSFRRASFGNLTSSPASRWYFPDLRCSGTGGWKVNRMSIAGPSQTAFIKYVFGETPGHS